MRQTIKFVVLAAAAAAASLSCTKEITPAAESGLIEVTIVAGVGTKTAIQDGTDKTMVWKDGDAIGVSDGTANVKFDETDVTGVSASATFSGTVPAAGQYYAYYPYSAAGASGISIPADQTVSSVYSFDPAADLLVSKPFTVSGTSVTVNDLEFKRLGAFIKVIALDGTTGSVLSGKTFSSMSITAASDLVGTVAIDLGAQALGSVSEGSKTVTANLPADSYSVGSEGGVFFGILPQSFASGATLEIKAVTSGVPLAKTVTLPDAVELKAGRILPLRVTFTDADIDIEIKNVAITAAVNSKKVFWSDATVTWTDVEGVTSYNMLLDGVKVGTVDAGVQTYTFTGLSCGTDYVLNVEAGTPGYEGKSDNINITTATVTKNTDNVGPTHVSFAIQDVTGGGTTANKRACAFQLSTTQDETGLVYDIYNFDGTLTDNSTTPYSTSSWLGKTSNKAVGIPLNISLGKLNPATTYYFRVKTVASYTLYAPVSAKNQTVTATNGGSEWSEWIAVTTEPAHVAASNEVIYGGFDALSFNGDFLNEACGTFPYVSETQKMYGTYGDTSAEESVRSIVSWPWTGAWRVTNFSGPIKVFGWNIADRADYVDGNATVNSYENLVFNDAAGDRKGWFVSSDFCPAMGTIMNRTTIAAGGHYVATPALTSPLLTSSLKDCTLSFKACRLTTGKPSGEGNTVVIQICRDGSFVDVETKTLPSDIFLPAKVDDKNNNVDYKFTDFSADLQLKSGDSVMIKSGANTRFVIDEIKIVVK